MATIKLQNIGEVNAKPAQEFKVGEKMLWNFGHTSTILEIVDQTSSFITFKEQSDQSNSIGKRRYKKTRLIGYPKLEIPKKLIEAAKQYNNYSEAYAQSCLWASHSYSIRQIAEAIKIARQ